MAENLGCITLNGTTQYVQVSHVSKIDFPSDIFMAGLWFKSSGTGGLINKYASSVGYKLELLANGKVRATVNNTSVVTASSSYADDAWHWVALGADRRRGVLYLFADTTLISEPLASGTAKTSANMLIGVNEGAADGFVSGSISEVRVRENIRTREPSNRIEAVTTLPTEQNDDDNETRLLLHMNEGKGATVFDSSAGVTSPTDTPVRANGTVINYAAADIWTVQGPLIAPPLIIARDIVLYTIDTSAKITQYNTRNRLKRYRGRLMDALPELTVHTTPLLAVMQSDPIDIGSEEAIAIEDFSSFQDVSARVVVAGGVYSEVGEIDLVSQLYWMVIKALHVREQETNGDFGINSVARMSLDDANFDPGLLSDQDGRILAEATPSFTMGVTFVMKRDLRTSAQP